MDTPDIDDTDGQTNYIVWNFTPYIDVPQNDLGMTIFLNNWQNLMISPRVLEEHGPLRDGAIHIDEWFVNNEGNRFPVLDFWEWGYSNERDTRVASTMIVWLGSMNGHAYLHEARNLIKAGVPAEKAYLYAWADTNIREPHSSHNRIPRDWMRLPDSKETSRDIEMMERVALWLGGEKGQEFLQNCEQQLAAKYEEQRKARMAKMLRPSGPA